MKKILLALLVLAVLYAGAVLGPQKAKEWISRRDSAFALVAAREGQIAALKLENQQLSIRVDAFMADVARRDTVIIYRRVAARTQPVPDTCQPIVAAYERVLEADSAQITDLRGAFETQRRMTANLVVSDSLKNISIDSLVALAADAPVGRSFWKSLIPGLRVTLGPSLGVDGHFSPLAVTVGASWKLPH